MNTQAFINAKHKIDGFLIATMAMNDKSLSFSNSDTGNGKECPLYGETHEKIKDWYESLCFIWNEVGDIITITWG